MNTFSIERGEDFASNIILSNNEDHPEFIEVHFIEDLENLLNFEELEEFIFGALEATDEAFGPNTLLEDTTVTLVDEDGYFIWSIVLSEDEHGMVDCDFLDWKNSGYHFCYAD